MITTVTGKKQITIPAELARELNISPGTRLDWAKGETGVLIVKIIPNPAELARRLAGRGRRHLREGSNPIRDLVGDRVPDGIRTDRDGNVWSAAGGGGAGFDGVHCYCPGGDLLGQIHLPETCANLCFGGVKKNRLFITASRSLYSVYLEARGAQHP
jgi:AbrB family looped-hinge helix DNA binding protein